jgi:hypothetical protein
VIAFTKKKCERHMMKILCLPVLPALPALPVADLRTSCWPPAGRASCGPPADELDPTGSYASAIDRKNSVARARHLGRSARPETRPMSAPLRGRASCGRPADELGPRLAAPQVLVWRWRSRVMIQGC